MYSGQLHLLLQARDQAEERSERFRLALIGSDPDKWLPAYFPDLVKDEREVSEEDIEEDEGITFQFGDMEPGMAEDLLAMAMAGAREGTVSGSDLEGEWR